jgi:hypothetical protein
MLRLVAPINDTYERLIILRRFRRCTLRAVCVVEGIRVVLLVVGCNAL